jgi:hypothetical protein
MSNINFPPTVISERDYIIALPGEFDTDPYARKTDLQLFRDFSNEFEQILPLPIKPLPEPGKLKKRSIAANIDGISVALNTEDGVGCSHMSEEQFKQASLTGKLHKVQALMVRGLMVSKENPFQRHEANVVFSARSAFYITSRGGRVPNAAYPDARIFTYRIGSHITDKPGIINPGFAEPSKRAFGIGIEMLKAINASR